MTDEDVARFNASKPSHTVSHGIGFSAAKDKSPSPPLSTNAINTMSSLAKLVFRNNLLLEEKQSRSFNQVPKMRNSFPNFGHADPIKAKHFRTPPPVDRFVSYRKQPSERRKIFYRQNPSPENRRPSYRITQIDSFPNRRTHKDRHGQSSRAFAPLVKRDHRSNDWRHKRQTQYPDSKFKPYVIRPQRTFSTRWGDLSEGKKSTRDSPKYYIIHK